MFSGFGAARLAVVPLARLLRSRYETLIGESVVREYLRIAQSKFGATPASLEFSLEVLRRQRIVPDGTEAFPSIGDPDDRPIVGSALAAEAERFVTGDQLLLVLKDLEGMPIVSPRECWERLLLAS
ncbi:PIN domain-containing protein [Thioalkalivibrio nitratireducens]|uniref:PIN domain-containing protein n=1 Tax=Thioalkalivibrio nitratireducens TaxID=186931 RepID=UPI0005C1E207|nr:hypothetical protein [Thioalkalivibrio nitratireducens]